MSQSHPSRIALCASTSPTASAFVGALSAWSGHRPAVIDTHDCGAATRSAEQAFRARLAALDPDLAVVIGMPVKPRSFWAAEPYYAGHALEADLLRAAAGAGVRRVLYVADPRVVRPGLPSPVAEDALLAPPRSAQGGYEDAVRMAGLHRCQYARTRLGLEVTAVVPALIYGNGGDVASPVRIALDAMASRRGGNGRVTVPLPAGAVWDLVHVDDLAAAALHVLEHAPGETVNAGSGSGLSTEDLLAMVVETACPGVRATTAGNGAGPEPLPVLDVTRLRALGFEARHDLRGDLAAFHAAGSFEPATIA